MSGDREPETQPAPPHPGAPADELCLASVGRHADRTLLRTALVFLACVPLSVAFGLIDERTLDGAPVWLKPIKFQLSVAIFLATLAVMVPLAGGRFRASRWGRATVWVAVATSVFEIAWITLQAARGQRSHYNDDSAFGAAMYAAMGVAAVALSLAPVSVAVATMTRRSSDPAFRIVSWGLFAGAVASLLGTGVVGILLGGSPDHDPGPGVAPEEQAGLRFVGWSTTGGDLRVAHFVGMHALQGVVLLGFLLRRAPVRWAQVTLSLVAFGWMASTAALSRVALGGSIPWSGLRM